MLMTGLKDATFAHFVKRGGRVERAEEIRFRRNEKAEVPGRLVSAIPPDLAA